MSYMEEGGEGKLIWTSGGMRVWGMDMNLNNWRLHVAADNSPFLYYCRDLVEPLSSPWPSLIISAIHILPPLLLSIFPLIPNLRTLVLQLPLLLVVPLCSCLVVCPLSLWACPPSHLSLSAPLSLLSQLLSLATVSALIYLTFSPSIPHLLLSITSLVSFISLLILLILHSRGRKTPVLNIKSLEQTCVKLNMTI